MLNSRILNLMKLSSRHMRMQNVYNVQPARLSHGFTYRVMEPAPKSWFMAAETISGIMWWWILWHLWHDFGHIVGEFPYPDASKWTDEELGILPEDSN